MPVHLSIDKLIDAVMKGGGPTMASQFMATISFPTAITSGSEDYTSEPLVALCQSATLAGTQIATTELPVYGPPVKMPYGLVYQDLVLSFLCTNSMAQRKVFEAWRRIIVDPTTNFVNYYDQYVGQVLVQKLNSRSQVVHTVKYEEAFPIAIFEQELSAGNNDWLRLTVQFSYRRWRTQLDEVAAERSIQPGVEIPTPPGYEQDPNDVFKDIPFPKVPK